MRTMYHISRVFVFCFICLIAFCQSLYAQTIVTNNDEWLMQMNKEELKIAAFTDEQIKNTILVDSIRSHIYSSGNLSEIPEQEKQKFADSYLKSFFRKKYLALHPEALQKFNPGKVASSSASSVSYRLGPTPFNILCNDGDFESGTTGSFVGYEDPTDYLGGLCGYVPFSNVAYTNVGFSNSQNFLVTNNVWDPVLPPTVLKQTNNGSLHAVRINSPEPCVTSAGMNMLQKTFTSPVSGKVKINFSYALVMEAPGHGAKNPFFVARVLNSAGVEVGTRICKVANASDPFFTTYTRVYCDRTSNIVFREWTCDFITFDMQANQTYTIEFFASDCGEGGHFGYAYVDDICAQVSCCPPAPKNVQCSRLDNGNKISWDPVPNAVRYQIIIHSSDPSCCKNSQYQFMSNWDVWGTDTIIPNTFTNCFSYTVNTVCKDSTVTESLQKYCSCTSECAAPTNLKCNAVPTGSKISWDPVFGAQGYQLIIYNNDPSCCKNGTLAFMSTWTVTGTDTIVPATFSPCFSWTINTICDGGLVSETLEKGCSCLPPCAAPVNLTCKQVANGSKLSWSAVSGADHYELVIYNSDPFCCFRGPLAFIAVWNVTGTDTIVPSSFSPCFSWYVNTVCRDGSKSQTLEKKCSCSPSTGGKPAAYTQGPDNNNVRNFDEHVLASATPNPASKYIEFKLQSLNELIGNSKLMFYLYDMSGRELIRKEASYNKSIQLDVQSYLAGEYIYEFRDANRKMATGKVLFENR